MDRIPQSALHRAGVDRSRARFLSPDSGKLSHNPPGVAGRDLLFYRLDYRDQTLSALCSKVRSLQSDLSRAGVHYSPANLDVSDLFAPASRRQIERNSSSRTRKDARSRAARACFCRACSLTSDRDDFRQIQEVKSCKCYNVKRV